jgi:Domain of unknown function (DUF4397)
MMRKLVLTLIALFILSGSLVAVSPAEAQKKPKDGYIRLTHAGLDAPTVDVSIIDGSNIKLIRGLAFGLSTDLMRMPPKKTLKVEIRPKGASLESEPVFKSEFKLKEDESVEVVALGRLLDNTFKLGVFPINRRSTDGFARLQVIHASPDAPAIDLSLDGKLVARRLSFGNALGRTLQIIPDARDVQVVAAGTTTPAVIDLQDVPFEANTVYTVIAVGKADAITALLLTSKAN